MIVVFFVVFLFFSSNLIPAGVYICNWVIVMHLHCPAKSCAPKGCPGVYNILAYITLDCVMFMKCLVCKTHYNILTLAIVSKIPM